ncbi:hypothetical protein D3C87_1996170 [compost metagenome]
MLNSSNKTGILCISEKLDTSLRLRVTSLENIDYLITELDPQAPELDAYRGDNLKIL